MLENGRICKVRYGNLGFRREDSARGVTDRKKKRSYMTLYAALTTKEAASYKKMEEPMQCLQEA